MLNNPKRILACLFTFIFLAGCTREVPLKAFEITPEKLKSRRLQTRRYDTTDEKKLLIASAALLQDLGFLIDESDTKLGVIVASKSRDATNPAQVAGAVILSLISALAGTYSDIRYNTNQKMRVSVTTRTIGKDKKSTALRVTFQRIVWNNKKEVAIMEQLNDPNTYKEFFAKLSKAVFLEAHQL